MRRGKQTTVFVVLVVILFVTLSSSEPPELHTIQGYVFYNEGSQVESGTKVKINATITGTFIETQTSGPPGQTGFYSVNIYATDGETVIVTALNATHYGRNSSSLLAAPSTTRLDLTLNNTRPAETDLDIFSPANNTIFDLFETFNINFNVTAIGGQDSTACNVTIAIANPLVINLTSDSTTISLGDILLGSEKNSSFELQALSEGSTAITLTSICASDAENFEALYYETINLRVANQPLQLHAIQGYILKSDNLTQVPSGTNVTINLTRTGQVTTIKTSGPPGQTGFYSTTILARDSDEIVIYSQNSTHEGNSTTTLLSSPSTTRVNVSLNTKKPIDLSINTTNILFTSENPIENINVSVNATIQNLGRGDLSNILVEFYNGYPSQDGIFLGNKTIPHISYESQQTIEFSFLPQIGINNIFVLVDPPITTNGSIAETNESNNQANNTLQLRAWQEFYGNITLDKILAAGYTNISLWQNETTFSGNLFIVDVESEISWASLQAIGKNKTNSNTTNDFQEIDTLLNMSSFADSVSNKFTFDGITSVSTSNFFVHNQNILNVPIINSTNTTNFITGILWDTNDDSDGEYSQSDKEDIIFVTKVNAAAQGAYGTYDYEITIPVKLREYHTTETESVYIYYDLQ